MSTTPVLKLGVFTMNGSILGPKSSHHNQARRYGKPELHTMSGQTDRRACCAVRGGAVIDVLRFASMESFGASACLWLMELVNQMSAAKLLKGV
jgi:hypothetical protein